MIQLDLKSRKSIYEQVIDGFKELITRGVLHAGDKLPSVRELSRTLTVNPNTIQKAYRQLEADPIEDNVKQLRYLGVADDEIRARLEEIACRKGVEG